MSSLAKHVYTVIIYLWLLSQQHGLYCSRLSKNEPSPQYPSAVACGSVCQAWSGLLPSNTRSSTAGMSHSHRRKGQASCYIGLHGTRHIAGCPEHTASVQPAQKPSKLSLIHCLTMMWLSVPICARLQAAVNTYECTWSAIITMLHTCVIHNCLSLTRHPDQVILPPSSGPLPIV